MHQTRVIAVRTSRLLRWSEAILLLLLLLFALGKTQNVVDEIISFSKKNWITVHDHIHTRKLNTWKRVEHPFQFHQEKRLAKDKHLVELIKSRSACSFTFTQHGWSNKSFSTIAKLKSAFFEKTFYQWQDQGFSEKLSFLRPNKVFSQVTEKTERGKNLHEKNNSVLKDISPVRYCQG